MRTFLIILLTLFLELTVFGTPQASDIIFYKGRKYKLHTNPLEKYFEKFPDKRPDLFLIEEIIITSANWRGYVATFEIRDNQLYLKDIEIQIRETENRRGYINKSILNDVFPNQDFVKVDWMTGLLVLPSGRMVEYVHMGYASTYRRYTLLEIDNGNLKNVKKFRRKNYEKFKEKQFQAFKKTDEYIKIKADLQKNFRDIGMDIDIDDEFIDAFLRDFVVEYTSKILIE